MISAFVVLDASTLDEDKQIESTEAEAAPQQELTIRVPASIGNFGPGFETVALAVKLYMMLKVRVRAPRQGSGIEISTRGPIAEQLALDSSNLISKVMEQSWPQDNRLLSCLSVLIDTEIPISSGLGSSAAATAAGVTAAMALSGMPLEKGAIFDKAAKIEGHPESACASVFGGFTICAPGSSINDLIPRKLVWPEKWVLIAVVPPYKLQPKKARSVLPQSVSHKDAVINVQRVALLIEAVAAGDDEAMKAALRDKLHEPYRSKLVPELAELRKLLLEFDVLGSVLSGSGPTVVTVLDRKNEAPTLERLRQWSTSNHCQIMQLEVDDEGLVAAN